MKGVIDGYTSKLISIHIVCDVESHTKIFIVGLGDTDKIKYHIILDQILQLIGAFTKYLHK